MNAPEQPSIVPDPPPNIISQPSNASDPPPNITSQPSNTSNPARDIATQPGKATGSGPEPGLIKLKHLSRVLNVPARWRILRELARGEALPVKELAVRARCPAASASKHMAVLRKAGLVTIGYGRLYKLSAGVQPEPGGRRLDLGHCVLKLDTAW